MTSKNVNEDEEESEYYETDRKMVHHKRDGDWDVPISEDIKYFDPELSYEITGYRPINMTQGLDFDPTPFQATGKFILILGNIQNIRQKLNLIMTFELSNLEDVLKVIL